MVVSHGAVSADKIVCHTFWPNPPMACKWSKERNTDRVGVDVDELLRAGTVSILISCVIKEQQENKNIDMKVTPR